MMQGRAVRASRVQELLRLVNEAQELDRDVGERRRHLVGGLSRLVGGCVAATVTSTEFWPGGRGLIADFAVEGLDASSAPMFDELVRGGVTINPALATLMAMTPSAGGNPLSRRREDIVPDDVWYAAPWVEGFLTRGGLEHCLFGGWHDATGAGVGAGLCRARHDRPFTEEDEALHDLYLVAIAPLWRDRRPSEVLRARLPSHLRRVYDLFLEGLSEKEVADRLGLRDSTVHGYSRDILRRLGLRSRAQLFAAALGTLK